MTLDLAKWQHTRNGDSFAPLKTPDLLLPPGGLHLLLFPESFESSPDLGRSRLKRLQMVAESLQQPTNSGTGILPIVTGAVFRVKGLTPEMSWEKSVTGVQTRVTLPGSEKGGLIHKNVRIDELISWWPELVNTTFFCRLPWSVPRSWSSFQTGSGRTHPPGRWWFIYPWNIMKPCNMTCPDTGFLPWTTQGRAMDYAQYNIYPNLSIMDWYFTFLKPNSSWGFCILQESPSDSRMHQRK